MINFFSLLAEISPGQPHHPHDFQGQARGIYIGPSLLLKLTVNLSEVDTFWAYRQLPTKKKLHVAGSTG